MLHFCKTNQGRTDTVNGRALGSAVEQRDKGTWVYSSVKVATQVDDKVGEQARFLTGLFKSF